MSITYDSGCVVFQCDECGDTFESETRNFNEAVARAKNEGWSFEKCTGGGYAHYCPDMQDK